MTVTFKERVMKKDWLTAKEAAEYIGYSPSTLKHWRLKKEYGPRYVLTKSGRIWYCKEDLDDWANACWSRASSRRQTLTDISG